MTATQPSTSTEPSLSTQPSADQSTTGHPVQGRRKRRGRGPRLLLTIAVILVGMATMAVTSLALFTDTETVGSNNFASGTIDITATPATAVVSAVAMAPGDQVTNSLTVANAGNLEFRYSLSSTTDENILASELVLTVKSGVTTCDDTNWTVDGTTIYSGVLGNTAPVAVFGDPTAGADPGDRVLPAASNEILCLNVTLPASTTIGQGVSSVATLTFEAEQTSNNP